MKDFSAQGRAYFADDYPFDDAAVAKNLKKDARLKELLPLFADKLDAVVPFTHDATEAAAREFAESNGVKPGLVNNAARPAVTGQSVGPSIFEVFVILGRERTTERLRRAIEII